MGSYEAVVSYDTSSYFSNAEVTVSQNSPSLGGGNYASNSSVATVSFSALTVNNASELDELVQIYEGFTIQSWDYLQLQAPIPLKLHPLGKLDNALRNNLSLPQELEYIKDDIIKETIGNFDDPNTASLAFGKSYNLEDSEEYKDIAEELKLLGELYQNGMVDKNTLLAGGFLELLRIFGLDSQLIFDTGEKEKDVFGKKKSDSFIGRLNDFLGEYGYQADFNLITDVTPVSITHNYDDLETRETSDLMKTIDVSSLSEVDPFVYMAGGELFTMNTSVNCVGGVPTFNNLDKQTILGSDRLDKEYNFLPLKEVSGVVAGLNIYEIKNNKLKGKYLVDVIEYNKKVSDFNKMQTDLNSFIYHYNKMVSNMKALNADLLTYPDVKSSNSLNQNLVIAGYHYADDHQVDGYRYFYYFSINSSGIIVWSSEYSSWSFNDDDYASFENYAVGVYNTWIGEYENNATNAQNTAIETADWLENKYPDFIYEA